jgi:hypothetical protein
MDDKESRAQFTSVIDLVYGERDEPSMDRLFRFLSRRGVFSVILLHQIYCALRLVREFAQGSHLEFEIQPVPISLATFFRLRLDLEDDSVLLSVPVAGRIQVRIASAKLKSFRKVRFIIVVFASSALCWTLLRCWYATFGSALRTVPFLIAFLILLFSQGDTWRLYGTETRTRIALLLAIIAILAVSAIIMALGRLKGGWRRLAIYESLGSQQLSKLVRRTPAENILENGTKPIDLSASTFGIKCLRLNLCFLFWFTLLGNMAAIAVFVFAFFVLIGTTAVSLAASKMLLGAVPAVLLQFHFLGDDYAITRPLIALSTLFGGVGALTYATLSLQDDMGLERFLNFGLRSYKSTKAALTVYLGALSELQNSLPWSSIYAQLMRTERGAAIELLTDSVLHASPRTISTIVEFARRYSLRDWAAEQGLELLVSLPHKKLSQLLAEDVDFILDAASPDPDNVDRIRGVKAKLSI